MPSLKALEVRRVSSSGDLTAPGDFAFIPKREPIRRLEHVPITPPRNFFKRIIWHFFGKKQETRQYIELQWPEYDAVILNCPHCNMPLATTKTHKIVSLEPLTIETPIGCEYSRGKGIATKAREQEEAVVFLVKDGKIIAA
ncbi:MAG: hypothetical protein M3O31_03735 [Acidobacteriota bacterium]|nr:hypothetical protein [Acidobacteriota bacterium]